MTVVAWMLAGVAAAWIGFFLLRFNVKRGLLFSIAIGVLASYLGGGLLGPMLAAGTIVAGEFNPFSVFAAFATAAGVLIVGEMIHRRFGI